MKWSREENIKNAEKVVRLFISTKGNLTLAEIAKLSGMGISFVGKSLKEHFEKNKE